MTDCIECTPTYISEIKQKWVCATVPCIYKLTFPIALYIKASSCAAAACLTDEGRKPITPRRSAKSSGRTFMRAHSDNRCSRLLHPFFTVSTSLTQVPAPPIPTPVPFYSPQAVAARQAAN